MILHNPTAWKFGHGQAHSLFMGETAAVMRTCFNPGTRVRLCVFVWLCAWSATALTLTRVVKN